MVFNTFLKSVLKIKHLHLFGESSHAKLSPPYRLELTKKMETNAKSAKKAGVLVLFYPNSKGKTHLVLILRKPYKGVHSSQVSFPGGKHETNDKSLMHTALREAEEEIGVQQHQLTVVRALSPLYIPPSNFIAYPYVAISKTTPHFIKQNREVEAIIEVSLLNFLDDACVITTKVTTAFGIDVVVPAFQLNKHIVWGATAMMLSELKDLLKQVL